MSKKFIFSAVALMAFSFAGMANEIEETKVEVETADKALILKEKDCLQITVDQMTLIDPNLTLSDSFAAALSYALFVACNGGAASGPADTVIELP